MQEAHRRMTKRRKGDPRPMKALVLAVPRADQFGGAVKAAAVEIRLRLAERTVPDTTVMRGHECMVLMMPSEAEGDPAAVQSAVFSKRNGIGIRSLKEMEEEVGRMAALYAESGCTGMGWAVIARELDKMYVRYDIFDMGDADD